MKKTITVDGNEACSNTAYMFTEVAGIYPITPSSPMAEHLDEWSHDRINLFNDKVQVVEMQSEAGAAGMIHGALQAGTLTTTFTASQGLLLMIPNMYKIAGEMLPGVMHVAARSLSTHALSIFGDHQDIYATRSTGWAMLASSSVQDTAYLSAVAHLSAIKASLPFMHFFDGFRTSHEIQKIEVLQATDYADMLDKEALERFRNRALNPLNPNTRGTAQNDDIYFTETESRNQYYNQLPDIVNEYMQQINKKAGTKYHPFNYYGSKVATKIIVAMGSVCETIKETIDTIKGDIGLVEVHLYRPFSTKYLLKVIPKTVKKIAVLDRTKEAGSNGEPLYLDIVSALKDYNVKIVGGRYGLSSRNTTPEDINAVYQMLDKPKNNFTIGIVDDITNLSLEPIPLDIKRSTEFLFYGYGSDGMVSASKSIMKIIGNNTDRYVQGYFEYDSKKSGGVTVSHLRFSNKPIRATYYVEYPKLLVVTVDRYFKQFELVHDMADRGILLINTNKSDDELLSLMTGKFKNLLLKKHITVYKIDADKIAKDNGLNNKISMIMESTILYLTKLMDYDEAIDALKKSIKDKFFKKGNDIINANIRAILEVKKALNKVNIPKREYEEEIEVVDGIFNMIGKRQGYELPTSAFIGKENGTFDGNTSCLEKRIISSKVPRWIKENCINCNQCSLVCPHGVIRPYLLDQKEYDKAPSYIRSRAMKAIGMDNYYFIIGISVSDCTGCGVCIKTCPGLKNKKALVMDDINYNEQEVFNYLEKNVTKKDINKFTIKGSQFIKPKFEFSGACAGCGETAYIKLLTQLFGNHLIISNATGCSSIYGASVPSMPYAVPWASSLFEDNAEYGFGMVIANKTIKNRIAKIMASNMDNENSSLFKEWLDNSNNYDVTKKVYDNLTDNLPDELKAIKDYIIHRSIWCIGGDGWAYDIGFSGIDHVLASNENINILVLDSQVYSNTGGQSSKASPKGSIASFTAQGKLNDKKDLARIAMSYPNAYVAQVSLGANAMQLIKAFKEADSYDGPSIIIAYTPCISHGIKGGMSNSVEMEKLATLCGYYPIFRRHPINGFTLDSKKVDFELYEKFLSSQTRYAMLKVVNPAKANELLVANKDYAKKTYAYYEKMNSM